MCKFSAKGGVTAETAKEGSTIVVGTLETTEGKVYGGFFDKVIDGAGNTTSCLVCVKNGTQLTLFATLVQQKQHGIAAREVVTMIDDGSKKDDYLRLKATGRDILLKALVGARAFVGVKADTGVEAIKKSLSDISASTTPAQSRELVGAADD